ncbi:MAG: hypothetical protein ACRDRU_06495 [Pseudonocardiaceae bacterium]
MAIESDGHSRGNPRIYELIENAPKVGKSPTIWAWPEVVDWLRVAGQPVPGPWPPHQKPRPNPEEESLPEAVVEPERPRPEPQAAPPATGQSGQSGRWPDRPAEDDTPPPRQGIGLLDS